MHIPINQADCAVTIVNCCCAHTDQPGRLCRNDRQLLCTYRSNLSTLLPTVTVGVTVGPVSPYYGGQLLCTFRSNLCTLLPTVTVGATVMPVSPYHMNIPLAPWWSDFHTDHSPRKNKSQLCVQAGHGLFVCLFLILKNKQNKTDPPPPLLPSKTNPSFCFFFYWGGGGG